MPTSARPSPLSETLSLALAMSDDDDDFQNPVEAISLAQTLIFSAHRGAARNKDGIPGSAPLGPSRAANRPRKRVKPSPAAAGKENRGVPRKIGSDSGAAGDRKVEGKMEGAAAVEGKGSPSEGIESGPAGCDEGEEVGARNGDVACLGESTRHGECEGNDRVGGQKMGLLVSTGSSEVEAAQPGMADSGGQNEVLIAQKGSYYSTSIEARLLGSCAGRLEGGPMGSSGEGEVEDFEAGTQLKELMNLCSEVDEEENRKGEVLAVSRGDSVECPLCGTDITDLGEELRLAHTNACLDTEENPKVKFPTDAQKPAAHQPSVDVVPVLEWLRTLGLSRYEEAFVREEIDWDTLQWLTEEDLLSLGIAALGPRKKIVHALNELRKGNGRKDNTQANLCKATVNDKTKHFPGNKLITEYFQGPAAVSNQDGITTKAPRYCSTAKAPRKVERIRKDSTHVAATRRHCNRNRKFKDIPSWCCIPGTPFRVDAFRYLRGDCSHWFLTHFHLDHYQGLTRNFCHGKIYCSSITAHLLNLKMGIPWERLHVLPLNEKISVAGVDLTCLDANHCPGSIIILFEPPNGKPVLHTGDFRFCEEMASSSILQSCHVHTLILDTTYCSPQYDFPKQEAVIQFIIDAIQAEAFNPKTLFLIGSYTIGKERVFLEVARFLRKKVYVGSAKLGLLQCLGLSEKDLQWFTVNEMDSHIHVVPMWTIASFKRMKHISNRYSKRFNLIIAFSPTGWTYGKGKKKSPGRRWQQGTIIRYEVPYSEHSSFTELREFVKLLSPDNIIPSVNNDGPESADAMVSLLTSDTLDPSGNHP
uniref:DNA cross-link repair 1A protein n=1 Tax=Anthurium amnicola TaxID=1678845 RepID=A0A1D1Z370_9ARAE